MKCSYENDEQHTKSGVECQYDFTNMKLNGCVDLLFATRVVTGSEIYCLLAVAWGSVLQLPF